MDTVPSIKLVVLLPKPKVTEKTNRRKNFLTFPNIYFKNYNVDSFYLLKLL